MCGVWTVEKLKIGADKLNSEKQNFARKAGPAQPRWRGQGAEPLPPSADGGILLMPLGAPQGVNCCRRQQEGEALR